MRGLAKKYKGKVKRQRARGEYRREYLKRHPGFLGFHVCMYCYKLVSTKDMQVDHIFPHSKMGSDRIYNLGPSCGKCNLAKSDEISFKYLYVGYTYKIVQFFMYLILAIGSGIGKVVRFILEKVVLGSIVAVWNLAGRFILIGAVLYGLYYLIFKSGVIGG